jgi:hypothetical protein
MSDSQPERKEISNSKSKSLKVYMKIREGQTLKPNN